jgi:glycosyltransferase involved in cell wall biosynthesis
MKIAHIINWYIPKMGYQENFLPAEQLKAGHKVIIITSKLLPLFRGFDKKSFEIECKSPEDNNVPIIRLPHFFHIKRNGQLLLRGLAKILNDFEPDIVHSHEIFNLNSIQAVIFQKRYKYKLFIDDHSHFGNFNYKNFFNKIVIILIKSFYKNKKRRIVSFLPVQYASERFIHFFFPKFKAEILHLGANNLIFFKDQKLREKTRKILNLNERDLLIITSGKFSENKDLDVLMKLFNHIGPNSNYYLLVIGNGPKYYMERIKKIIQSETLQKKVFFLDFLKNLELNKYYNAADIGIWPGNHTIGVFEAISSGLPVIIPQKDLGYKILFDNCSALSFSRGNFEELIEKTLLLGKKKNREEN